MERNKTKAFEFNVLGLISIKTEDLSFNQKLLIIIIILLFTLVTIVLLNKYLIPTLSIFRILKKIRLLKDFTGSNSP